MAAVELLAEIADEQAESLEDQIVLFGSLNVILPMRWNWLFWKRCLAGQNSGSHIVGLARLGSG